MQQRHIKVNNGIRDPGCDVNRRHCYNNVHCSNQEDRRTGVSRSEAQSTEEEAHGAKLPEQFTLVIML